MLRWALAGLVAASLLFAALVAAIRALDIDIPCQDGRWDEARGTCIPT